jgi:hypothetical protein
VGWLAPWVVGTAVTVYGGLLAGVFLAVVLFGLKDAEFSPMGRLIFALFWGVAYWVPVVASSLWQGWWGRSFVPPWGWIGATAGGGLLGVGQMFDFGDLNSPQVDYFLGIAGPLVLWLGTAVGQGLYLWFRVRNWEMLGTWLGMTLGAMVVWGIVSQAVVRLVPGTGVVGSLLLTGILYGLGGGLGLSPLLSQLRR